jgi:hypothetical protein
MLTKTMIAIATLTFAASLAHAGGNDVQIDKSKQLLRPMAGCVVKGHARRLRRGRRSRCRPGSGEAAGWRERRSGGGGAAFPSTDTCEDRMVQVP